MTTPLPLRWGVLSTGRIAHTFARALPDSAGHGVLAAVGSRDLAKATAFVAELGPEIRAHGSYEALLADPGVDAVYIATPHPQHCEWVVKAAEAGKHILVEKPAGVTHAEAMIMTEAAHRHGVFFMEAFMYRCHPLWAKVREIVASGVLGELQVIEAHFAFRAGLNPEGRLFKAELAGGGILDVGCYTLSAARLIAGVAQGQPFAEPTTLQGMGLVGQTGVDEYAIGQLSFPGGIVAQISTGVRLQRDNYVRVYGTLGKLVLDDPWFCRGDAVLHLYADKSTQRFSFAEAGNLYALEAQTVARYVDAGEAPAMSRADTLGNALALDKWRAAVGVVLPPEKAASGWEPIPDRRPVAPSPTTAPIPQMALAGLPKTVSRLVMGVDNQPNFPHALAVFDDYFAQGGNCFDTAITYGGWGRHEKLLADWILRRGVREQVVFLNKGCHTPWNFPQYVKLHIEESLERTKMGYFDIWMMHRDNPEVPVDEFVDALEEQRAKGHIRVYGASNWTLARVQAAQAYAARKGYVGFGALSNNFSLARMVSPVWPGCEAASTPEFRQWHEATQVPLFPWSSQARGFFTERAGPDKLGDAELVRCWYSPENFERRARAVELAKQKGVSPLNIALAYVLHQSFPVFALIGPRTLEETRTTLPGARLALTPAEVAWLDLRS